MSVGRLGLCATIFVDLIEMKSSHRYVLFSLVNEKLSKSLCQETNCRSNVGKKAHTERAFFRVYFLEV